jgi:hypothetical protein
MQALVLAVIIAMAGEPHGRIESPTIDPGKVPSMLERESKAPRGRGRVGPSGYWTGYRPSQHGAYRWPLMAVGGGVLALTILGLFFGLRRVGRKRLAAARPGDVEREARDQGHHPGAAEGGVRGREQ